MKLYYSVNIFLTVISMTIMIISVKYNFSIDKRRKMATAALFIVIIIAALCEWGGTMLDGAGPELRFLHIAVKAIELSVAPFTAILCSLSIADNKFRGIISAIMLINVVLELISAFTGFIYYVDSANFYHHGNFYWIYMVFCSLALLMFFYDGISTTRKYQYTGGRLIFLVLLLLSAGLAVQLTYNAIKVEWIVTAISAIMLYKFHGDMLSQSDGLTGLINRLGYENYISRFQGQGVIIIFDIDNFKYINDTYGHIRGDHYLREVATALRKVYNSYGKTFRIGGDEFCVIVEKNYDNTERYNRSFYAIINQKRLADRHFPDVSCGYTKFDTQFVGISVAAALADSMMYKNKEKKRKNNPSEK